MTERDELVAALLGVPGVAGATVDAGSGGPGTLRLQLAPGVDEVGVAGEVNHLLRSRFGLAVDTDRVRVVEEAGRLSPEQPVAVRPATGESDAPSPAPRAAAPAGRIVIERVQLVSAGLSTTVVVTLALHGRAFSGSAEGTASAGSLNRAVAAATLRALEAILDGRARFDIEHVDISEAGPDRTALAVVTMVTDRVTQRLSGASVVREDVRQAVIRAVLAALNRRVALLLDELEPVEDANR